MPDKDRIFLSPEEAMGAIRADFSLYPPQNGLFLELGPRILGAEASLVEDARNGGIWIASPHRTTHRMQKISGRALGEMLLETLQASRPPPAALAGICSRIFETPVRPGKNSKGIEGVWVDTCMENFHCLQCGRCCRELDYTDTVSESDYRLWETQGRDEILKWVGNSRRNGRITSRTIWMVPGTRDYARTCPWLHENSGCSVWECLIHDVKPEICRQYPGTLKHARMTGCPGFSTSHASLKSNPPGLNAQPATHQA